MRDVRRREGGVDALSGLSMRGRLMIGGVQRLSCRSQKKEGIEG